MFVIVMMNKPRIISDIDYLVPKAHAQVVDDRSVVITPQMLSDVPVLYKIAKCESSLRQYKSDGSVLTGVVNPHDIGLWQINTDAWSGKAKSLGYDVYTTMGNLAMARYIYRVQGTAPWIFSRDCWDKK